MKVCIDCRMYGEHFGGIGRYVKEILLNLLKSRKWNFYLIVSDVSISQEIGKLFPNKCQFILLKTPIFSIKEQISLPFLVPKCDIFWSPYMNVPFLPVKAKNRVVTLHDVFHLANPQYYGFMKRLFIKSYYHFSCSKSDRIITVSDFSKNEIKRYCGNAAYTKTVRVYNGIDIDTSSVEQKENNYKYILFVGNIKPHKNLKNALLGFKNIADTSIKFVIVGKKDGFITADGEVMELVRSINADNQRIIFTGNISDEELYVWYKGASMLIQPSFYEGFGLPIIEAMKFGLPIACSDIPVFKEIGQALISYFDPYSPNSITACLNKVDTMPKIEYPNWISWGETAKQIAEEFEKLASK